MSGNDTLKTESPERGCRSESRAHVIRLLEGDHEQIFSQHFLAQMTSAAPCQTRCMSAAWLEIQGIAHH